MTPWEIRGRELANCNCAYGAPVNSMLCPRTGRARPAVAFEFDSGHYGDVSLGGLRAAAVYKWPGPVHLGDGQMQLIIDENASSAQRERWKRS
ncbi:MAG: hypothetical protein AcusKO_39870 [Acuticoccus sp.]